MSATATNYNSQHPLLTAIVLALIAAALNFALWWGGNYPHGPEDWHGKIDGFALSAFQRYQSPLKGDFP
ncbi:MAG: hypothetical protein ABI389_04030, partial [Rhodanobacter sp.]